MRNNIFQFEPNKPEVIQLKYPTGKPFQKGDYRGFTYTLANGLICFFPPEADKEIQALHVAAGEPFRVTKRSLNGSGFAWDIERVTERPAPEEEADRPAPTKEDQPKHITNGNGVKPPILTTRESSRLYQQLVASIESVRAAEQHAALIGFPIKFQPEDVRAMAISGFIQQERAGY